LTGTMDDPRAGENHQAGVIRTVPDDSGALNCKTDTVFLVGRSLAVRRVYGASCPAPTVEGPGCVQESKPASSIWPV
jgi:hypothetical protein